ncbi:MAG: hypothetical protein DDT34_00880 [Firmicutes bacterium]|nr:hypothetical protein [Bacillota bacterium]
MAACNLLIELMAELTDEDNLLDWRIGPTRQLLLRYALHAAPC